MGIFVNTKNIKKKTQLLLFRPGLEYKQQASSYFRKSTKITWCFAVVVVAACTCFVVWGQCPCRCQQLACVTRTASVARLTRVPRVMAAAFFLLIVFVDPDTCVIGDQGHDFARSA